jgi:hypothetical protein
LRLSRLMPLLPTSSDAEESNRSPPSGVRISPLVPRTGRGKRFLLVQR